MPTVRATRPIPASFYRLTAMMTAAAAAVLALTASAGDTGAFGDPQFWLLAGLTVAMELLPIRLPRGGTSDVVTVSSAFALAALFLFGPFPAVVLWTLAAVTADLIARIAPVKVLFNGAQYAVCMGAAAAAFELAGGSAPVELELRTLPEMVVAAAVFFLVNHVLAGAGVALLTRSRVVPFLVADLALLTWTTGFQLALAPLLVGAPGVLVALGAVPVLAIYLGGRQAAHATHAANHDALTGLANRMRFTSALSEVLAHRRGERRTWLVLVDLDDFKSINDTLGHHCGDALLRYVATRMSNAVREGDVLARLGGDEFAVLLGDCDESGARAGAQRLLDQLSEPFRVGDLSLRVSASAGVASCEGAGLTAQMLYQQADVALYRAKKQRGAVALYTAHSELGSAPAVDRIALGSELAHALAEGTVFVTFQPKVAVTGDLPPAMEALVRWRHPQLGLVDPQAFVAIAEETGMIKRLTERVLELALERCAGWHADGIPLRMSVNLSAKSLVDESLPGLVREALERHGMPGDALQFEITETAAVANVPRSRAVLDALRGLGVTLAIDDFGTGFSSLTQLQSLDLEEVKIDRSFVMAMEDDPQAAVIVRSVVNLGHSLGLRVCAEGVESAGAVRRLRELGCDYLQGYLFGQPSADAAPVLALNAAAPGTAPVGPQQVSSA